MKIFVIAVVLLTLGFAPWLATRAGAQGVDSCLRLVCVNGQPMGGDSGRCLNPDSVVIDTCLNSPTYGEYYASHWWEIQFAYYVINVHAAPADTTLEMSWTAIDTSYAALRTAFARMERRYGTLILRKAVPNDTDSTDAISKGYFMRFKNYVCVDSVMADLEKLPDVDSLGVGAYLQVHFNGYPGTTDSGTLGVSEGFPPPEKGGILLVPNPTLSFLRVSSADGHPLENVVIYDVSGKKIFQKDGINYAEFQCNIQFLLRGTYWVVSGQGVAKLVIAR